MSIDYAALTPGQKVSTRSYRLDVDTVARYVDAVDDRSGIFDMVDEDVVVPPMAIAALSLRGVINDLSIPGGTLHTNQELEFHNAVRVGEKLKCIATLVQSSVRVGRRFMVLQMQVEDGNGRQVMTGRSTITVAT